LKDADMERDKKRGANRALCEASRHVFAGRVFEVVVDRVRLPHGAIVEMEVVRHEPSVVLIPFDADGRILLVRQYRYAVDRWLWELPAGGVEAGESPEAAAAREAAEEIGLRPGTIDRLGAFYPTPGFCDETMLFFELRDLRPPGQDDPGVHVDEDEDLEVRAFTLEDIRALVARGEIQDMKTVAGLWLIENGLGLRA
jgi:ADP-ribose pyrophosphatase